jgi:ketosteroid isomerase-like protein
MRNLKQEISELRDGLQIVAVLAIVVLAACTPQGAAPSPELAAMSDRWDTGINTGDIDLLVSMYTSDCRLMAPNAPMMQGSDAVRAVFGGMIEAGITVDIETIEAAVAGDIGYRVGTYALFAPDGAQFDNGKYIELWQKTGAGWQISDDVWNSDFPADAGKTFVNITHEVKDKDVWLAAWTGPNSRRAMFAENGAGEIKVFQSPDDPNRVGLLVEITDMDAMVAWLASPDSAAAKAEDGVIDSTIRLMTEVK